MARLTEAGTLKCGNCGRENRPGTRLCTRCRFVLRGNEAQPEDRGPQVDSGSGRPRKRGIIYRIRHDRRTAMYALVVVMMIIAVSVAVYHEVHKDDPSLSANLYYRYVPPTETSGGMVRLWGEVYNWGGSGGTVFVEVRISDQDGHSSSYTVDLGRMPSEEGVDVDEMLDWPYYCVSTLDLTLTYKVDHKSDWWF